MSSGEIGRRLGVWIHRRCDVPRISRFRLGVLARVIGQEDGMFTMPFRKLEREQGAFLNETQRTLINEKI
jgi:hypothetical protein